MRPGLLDGGPGGKPPGKQLHFLPRARQRRPFNPPVPFESWRVPCRACLRILGSGKRNVRIRGEPWLFCELIWRAAATRRLSVSARGECLRRHASRAAFWRSGRHCAPRDKCVHTRPASRILTGSEVFREEDQDRPYPRNFSQKISRERPFAFHPLLCCLVGGSCLRYGYPCRKRATEEGWLPKGILLQRQSVCSLRLQSDGFPPRSRGRHTRNRR
jgi:hypothetical protein